MPYRLIGRVPIGSLLFVCSGKQDPRANPSAAPPHASVQANHKSPRNLTVLFALLVVALVALYLELCLHTNRYVH